LIAVIVWSKGVTHMIYRILAVLLTLVSVSTARDNSVPAPNWFDNKLYLGFTAGYTNMVGQLQRSLDVKTSDRAVSVGEGGVVPGVFVGYQRIIDNTFYMAVEGDYQQNDIFVEKEEHTFPAFVNYLTSMKNNNKASIAGKIGFINRGNIFYLKAGVAFSRFVLSFKDKNDESSATSIAKRERGIVFGAGMDYFITKSVSLGAEYEITKYQHMDFQSNTAGKFTFKPVAHAFMLRFKYML
jgi:opacity protein-like surface antigen